MRLKEDERNLPQNWNLSGYFPYQEILLSDRMAANYWASTQCRHWQFSRESLAEVRQALDDEEPSLAQQYPLPERRHLSFFFNQRKL